MKKIIRKNNVVENGFIISFIKNHFFDIIIKILILVITYSFVIYIDNKTTEKNTIKKIESSNISENNSKSVISSTFMDYRVNKDSKHININYNTNDEWLSHFNRLKNSSIFDIDDKIDQNSKILVLQTCMFGKYRKKLLVISAVQL